MRQSAMGSCPGSPGYQVHSAPAELPFLPAWIARPAGKPRPRSAGEAASRSHARAEARLEGVIDKMLAAGPGDHRRNLAFWSACRAREMVQTGDLDLVQAERVLFDACVANGLVAKRGEAAVRRTIADGLRGEAA
jgi:hypothetical protein